MSQEMITSQMETWQGKFGQEYTDRNAVTVEDVDKLYEKKYGKSRLEMDDEFIGHLNRNIKILEVGSNVGTQLLVLQKMGFNNLYGIELQSYAVEKSKDYTKGINIIQGHTFDIPFKDQYFDLVFTSGLLICIKPQMLDKALDEIYRCSKKYILGFECYSENLEEIDHRGNKDFCWKCEFSEIYLDQFKDLKLIRKEIYPFIDEDNKDFMFLLEKE